MINLVPFFPHFYDKTLIRENKYEMKSRNVQYFIHELDHFIE